MRSPTEPRASGAHFVYTELKRRILSLELAPGERLLEPGLAASLGVSRTPLREAIRRLISENLLQQQPTGGVTVPELDPQEIAELYEVRASLEALMASAACAKATPADVDVLEQLVARNAALVEFAEESQALGTRFHATIAEIADHSWASRLHEQVANQMQRYRTVTNRTREHREAAVADHRRICALIAADDPDAAGRAAHQHVLMARDEALRQAGTAGPVETEPSDPPGTGPR